MEAHSDIVGWFARNHELSGPKIVAGLRGRGKSAQLAAFGEYLVQTGVKGENILILDAESSLMGRFFTHDQVLDYIQERLSHRTETNYVLIREAAQLPDPEIILGTLAASSRYRLFLTTSTKRLFSYGLDSYFSNRLSVLELPPPPPTEAADTEAARQRWNDAFLNDVLIANRIVEGGLAYRTACYLSNALAEPLSLRQICHAISPSHRILSPHTVNAYLNALSDAYLVEKALRYDLAEETAVKTGYRYFFTAPAMRLAKFGPATAHEPRRAALNHAWITLRRTEGETFVADGAPNVDFVTHGRNGIQFWHLDEAGALQTVSRDTFIAGARSRVL